MTQTLKSVNIAELAEKGKNIYQEELKDKLEKKYFGKFVAIDTESKEYYIGDNETEATQKARKKNPNRVTYLVKIGFPAVYTMHNQFEPPKYGSVF